MNLVCVCVCVYTLDAYTWLCVLSCFSRVQLSAIPWTAARQAPLSMEFFRQEYWNGLLFPTSGIFLTQGLNLCFLRLLYWQVGSLPLSYLGSPKWILGPLLTNKDTIEAQRFQSLLVNSGPSIHLGLHRWLSGTMMLTLQDCVNKYCLYSVYYISWGTVKCQPIPPPLFTNACQKEQVLLFNAGDASASSTTTGRIQWNCQEIP